MKNLVDYPIEHIGFVVQDLEKTIEHLGDIFGIKNFSIYEISPMRAWSYGKEIKEYKLRIAMSVMESSKIGFEIIQPLCNEGIHKVMAESDEKGINHIAFKVDDYDYWRSFFIQKGADIIFESEIDDELNGFRRCCYVKDNQENFIYELKEKAYFRNK